MGRASIFVFGLLFFNFFAQASVGLEGQWTGWADWNYQGSGTHCSVAEFVFHEDSAQLTREAGHLECDYASMDFPSLEFKKEANDLFIGDQKVGHFASDEYSWSEVYSETVTINVTIRRVSNRLSYREQWIDNHDQLIYDIQSSLFTQ